MLLTPVAISLFAFIALVSGTVLFFAVERRVASLDRQGEPQRR